MVAHRISAEYHIPRRAQILLDGLKAVSPRSTIRTFYLMLSDTAEKLLFSHIPWTDSALGSIFSINGRDGQKDRRRCRIYVKGNPFAIELSLPNIHKDIRGLPEGAPQSAIRNFEGRAMAYNNSPNLQSNRRRNHGRRVLPSWCH